MRNGLLQQAALEAHLPQRRWKSKNRVGQERNLFARNCQFGVGRRSYAAALRPSNRTDLSAPDFRVMSETPWFPVPVTREESPTNPQEMSDRDFRVAFKLAFQWELMRIFFAEVRKLTGPGNDKELFARLGIDVKNQATLSDWYARARGARLPRPSVVNALRQQVPGLRLELHHPMLRWLSKPKLDERSVRRLKALMPEPCVTLIESLKKLKAHELTISLGLYERLSLHEMTYLDALFAFAYARNGVHHDREKIEQLNRILWALPIVYPDDPLWIGSSDEKHRRLAGIDYALGLTGAADPSEKWDGIGRAGLIADQLWHTAQRREKHPRALGTPLTRGRYWAKVWRWHGAWSELETEVCGHSGNANQSSTAGS